MLTVSFQGTALSRSERERLALERQVRAWIPAPSPSDLIPPALLLPRSEPLVPVREWSVLSVDRGTPFLGDCFGF